VRILLIVPALAGAVLIAAHQDRNEMERNPLAGSPEASAAGERLFQQTCASCHGDSARAPSLATGAFARGGQDGEIFQNIRNGIPATQMPRFSGFSTERIWQLVAYVRSLTDSTPASGPGPATAAAPPEGDAAAGETIFSGKGGCASCHQIHGRGGIVGPDLSAAGTRPADALRQKILDPGGAGSTAGNAVGGRGGAAPAVIIATTLDGREITGVARSEDTFSLQMVDASGQLHLLDKAALAEVRHENRSLMPGDYATRLSGAYGDGTPFPGPVNSAMTPGQATAGRSAGAPCG
jgi:putative heme-binding domain-containing protein